MQLQGAQYARDFTEATHRLYPDIADDVMSIYTHGAMQVYRPLPPMPVPGDGYPNNSQKTKKIADSLWEDIRQRKVAVCATVDLMYGARFGIHTYYDGAKTAAGQNIQR